MQIPSGLLCSAQRFTCSLILLSAIEHSAFLLAATPEQFQVWGTAAAEIVPEPVGWTEVTAEAELMAPLSPTPEEASRSYILFGRDPFSVVRAKAVPAASERITELRAFATPGEYEPVTLGIYALEDLKSVRITASALRSADSSTIPADQVDVRAVRSVRVPVDSTKKTFRWEPFLLERREEMDLPKTESAVAWLTLKFPADAKAGDYTGTISVKADGHPSSEVKLVVKVLPFTLAAAPIQMVMYYMRPAESDAMLMKELVDMREHGINSPVPAMEVRIKSRDRKFGQDDIAETKAYNQRLLSALKEVYGGWKFPLTFEAGHQIAYEWDPGKGWFKHWPHTPEMENDLCRAIEVIQEIAQVNGSPALWAYLIDEAGAHNLLDEAVYLHRLIKSKFPNLASYTSIGGGMALGFDEIGQLSGVVDFLDSNRFTPEIARALVARKKPYGIYNGAGTLPARARSFFGFYGWKTGAEYIGQWAYAFGEAGLRGLRQEDEGYVYHAKDGPLPSLLWEAVREGIDDYRYLNLLAGMVSLGKESSQTSVARATIEAERTLTNILAQLDWGFQPMQSSDRTPPPEPSMLRKWRKQVAEKIVALQKAGVSTRVPEAVLKTVRPNPLSLAWVAPEKEPVQFGPEILPASDFETALKPWRVEAWNGKGQGQVDASEHHSGSKSVRIDVPAASGNSAVTVLVWPQYGDGKLNISLEGERTYQFSAWVKTQNRNTLPELRVNVPTKAVAVQRTGKDPANAEGWQRLWLQVQLKVPAQPNYLAIWVQGPGTVWLDDLSLREVIPPPLLLALDQSEYDEEDKIGVASFSITRGLTPARIVTVMENEQGQTVASLNLPFQAQHALSATNKLLTLVSPVSVNDSRLIFNPSALNPGKYAMKVSLLDRQGKKLAEKIAPFRRDND